MFCSKNSSSTPKIQNSMPSPSHITPQERSRIIEEGFAQYAAKIPALQNIAPPAPPKAHFTQWAGFCIALITLLAVIVGWVKTSGKNDYILEQVANNQKSSAIEIA